MNNENVETMFCLGCAVHRRRNCASKFVRHCFWATGQGAGAKAAELGIAAATSQQHSVCEYTPFECSVFAFSCPLYVLSPLWPTTLDDLFEASVLSSELRKPESASGNFDQALENSLDRAVSRIKHVRFSYN